MSYYTTWIERSENNSNEQEYIEYVNRYYQLEKGCYEKILGAYPDNAEFLNGQVLALSRKFGFNASNMEIFVGFLDGIKSSLKNGDALDLEAIVDETEISLDIDYEKLYYNMHDAKADWLYNIPAWKNVLTVERMKEITHDYRVANIAHSDKIGRNDPCPCGSGKKYKNCCGKKV